MFVQSGRTPIDMARTKGMPVDGLLAARRRYESGVFYKTREIRIEELNSAIMSDTSSIVRIPFYFLNQWTRGFDHRRLIGSGSFGEVYCGTVFFPDIAGDKTSRYECEGRRVAVKKVNSNLLTTSSSESGHGVDIKRRILRAAKREIQALEKFRSNPNIIRLIGYTLPDTEAGQHLEHICLVYELASRGSLLDMILSDSSVDWQQRVRIAIDISNGLRFLHSLDIYHRDIKSSNIVLTSKMTAKIIDYGLSKSSESDNQSISVSAGSTGDVRIGTRGYMCPEYSRSNTMPFDAMCEAFSFGIVLMELITGRQQGMGEVFLEDNIEDIPPDGKAGGGEWHTGCVEALKSLSKLCTEKRRNRIRSFDGIMKELQRICDLYCPITETEKGLQKVIREQQEELETLRAKDDLEEILKAFQELYICDVNICGNGNGGFLAEKGVFCGSACGGVEVRTGDPKIERRHFICTECFDFMVVSQTSPNNSADFNNYGCRIYCPLCPKERRGSIETTFDDDVVCKVASSNASKAFISAKELNVRIVEMSRQEALLEAQKQMFAEKLVEEQAKYERDMKKKRALRVEFHRMRIIDRILTSRCPNCNLVFGFWDACFSVECDTKPDHEGIKHGCRKFFCGWCVEQTFSTDYACHEHVYHCSFNPRRGEINSKGTYDEFITAQAKRRTEAIEKYLQEEVMQKEGADADVIRGGILDMMREVDLQPLKILL